MAIFINNDSRVIVQGMTGAEGHKHTTRMLASGTTIVGGVNPVKQGPPLSSPAHTDPWKSQYLEPCAKQWMQREQTSPSSSFPRLHKSSRERSDRRRYAPHRHHH